MVKSLLIKNSAFGVLQLVLTAILTFISVPLFINKLGLERYGIWAVVAVIGNLSVLTNLGLNRALVVFVARQGKSKESDYDIAITQIILFSFICLFSSLIFFNTNLIVNTILSIPIVYSIEAQQLIILLVLANGLLLFGQSFTAVIDASQRMYITNICQFVYSLFYWVGQITILFMGGGLYEVGVGALVAAILWLFLVYIIYKKIWGRINLNGLMDNFKRISLKQLSYGSRIYIAGLSGFLFEPLSKVLLSRFLGLDIVAFFEIGLKVKAQLNGLLVKILNPLFPYIAQEKDNRRLYFKLNDISFKIQLLVIPIAIILIFILKVLIQLWLGPENLDQITVFVITMTVTLIVLQPSVLPVYHYLQSKDLADKTIYIQLSSVVINAFVFIICYKVLGDYAILISNCLGLLAAYSMCIYYKSKYLDFSFIDSLNYYFKLLVLSILSLTLCFIIRYFVPIGIWDLIIYPFIVVITFIYFVRWVKLISKDDLSRYFETLPHLKNTLFRILIAKK